MSAPAPIAGGPTAADGPALGLLELATVARGVVVADAALKRAPAVLLSSRTLSGGKLLVVLAGGVAEVEEAMAAGKLAAGDRLRDRVELAYADAQVWPMLAAAGVVVPADWADDAAAEALAIVETATVCAAIAAADAACKAADVVVRDVRLAVDLAGKAYFTMTGDLDAVDAAAAAAAAAAGDRLVELERIAQPAPELRGRLFF
ncbi:MAG: BMC domain-containing protein [Myxococcales bacterium]|nr:BMC domain-containing protein [Myxococcales bacterium]MBK7198485.1 BMC domain-containing protein [Myxococcales bacterium]MBP6847165.1 BMC domain-containing protein [Kofleriaceae bacterium]